MGKKQPNQPIKPSPSRKKSTGFQVFAEPTVAGKTEEDSHKFEVSPEPYSPPAYEELGPLPATYGKTELFLIARDPRWLFTYWDVNWALYPASRMRDGERKIFLKITEAGGAEEASIEVNPEARNWYVPVKKAATTYYAELGFYNQNSDWETIVRSEPATTPADSLSEDAHAQFATVPFHITFQRLIDIVRDSMAHGETLIHALSRLQGGGGPLAFERGKIPNLTEEQKRVLATLVGEEAVSKISMGSGDIDQLLRKALLEKLQSESSSEISAKGKLAELLSTNTSLFSALGSSSSWGPEVSSLFSAMGVSQQEVTSLFSALGAWGPGVSSLSSAAGGYGGASSMSSAAGAYGAESSSLSSGMGGWGPGVTSLSSGLGAFGPELSSLSSAMGGFGVELSSLFSAMGGFGGPESSSLFSAAGAWGPDVSSLFSATGASWSTQPFSVERGALMNVSAEVVVYGGTEPGATLWIDGKEIKRGPDGSFRYHFKFPTGDYDIPIVAKSPDGLQERTASMSFRHGAVSGQN